MLELTNLTYLYHLDNFYKISRQQVTENTVVLQLTLITWILRTPLGVLKLISTLTSVCLSTTLMMGTYDILHEIRRWQSNKHGWDFPFRYTGMLCELQQLAEINVGMLLKITACLSVDNGVR